MKRARKSPRRAKQLSLPGLQPTRAGKRRGPKLGTGRRSVRHRVREAHAATHPLHVVMRSKMRSLRTQFVFPTLRRAFAEANRARPGFRITQFSVQGDHVHLIVEAEDKASLSRGMQGLAIRIARRINALVRRRGKLWADRFFSRELATPRVVRNALAYVLNNHRKHRAAAHQRLAGSEPLIDPYSSAPYFRGFLELRGRAPCEIAARRALPLVPSGVPPLAPTDALPVVIGKNWLTRLGWQRAGLIAFSDAPAALP